MEEVPQLPEDEVLKAENKQIYDRFKQLLFRQEGGELWEPEDKDVGLVFFATHPMTGQDLQVEYIPVTKASAKEYPGLVIHGLKLPVISLLAEPRGREGLYTSPYGVVPDAFRDNNNTGYFAYNTFYFDITGNAVKEEELTAVGEDEIGPIEDLPQVNISLSGSEIKASELTPSDREGIKGILQRLEKGEYGEGEYSGSYRDIDSPMDNE